MSTSHWENLKSYELNLKNIHDDLLLEQLGNLFQREKKLADAILVNLQEVYERKLYAKLGYGSMFEMLVKHFGHGESAAYQRTSALKMIQVVPSAQQALARGETTMTTLADTHKFICKLEKEKAVSQNEKEMIFDQVKGKTRKEALHLFAEINPVAALPETKEKFLTAEHTLLQVTVDQETLSLINQLKSLLSHEIPDGNLNLLLKRVTKAGLEQLKKQKGRSEPLELKLTEGRQIGNQAIESKLNDRNAFHEAQASTIYFQADNHKVNTLQFKAERNKHRKAIPKELRRQVFARAKNQCEYLGINGHRCASDHQLEIDHVIPWSHGGLDVLSNLRVCCKVHNNYRTNDTHGFWFKPIK
jgi:hypothetical protein